MTAIIVISCAVSAIVGSASAVAAPAASFKAEQYPATVSGAQVTGLVFTTEEGPENCTSATVVGTLSGAATQVGLTPEFAGCKVFGVYQKIRINGCQLVAHVGGTSPFPISWDVACPVGSPGIEFAQVGTACTTTYLPQSGITGGYANNGGAGSTRSLLLTVNMRTLSYKEVGAECPDAGTHQNGRLQGTIRIGASAVSGAQEGVWIE
jgi:hypothetical protein